MDALRHVAVKIHTVNTHWPDAHKSSYIRHAIREYQIHKSLSTHPNVVALTDVFEIDANSFATVIEYCEGGDLDQYLSLRETRTLPEREAKVILQQVIAGLRYLNDRKTPVM